jgi:hypothetical protein
MDADSLSTSGRKATFVKFHLYCIIAEPAYCTVISMRETEWIPKGRLPGNAVVHRGFRIDSRLRS